MRAALYLLVGTLSCSSPSSPPLSDRAIPAPSGTTPEVSSKAVANEPRLAPANWREILPALAPRKSKYGELCAQWDRDGCEELCDKGSALSCARLGTILLVGGAENPLLPVTKFEPEPNGSRTRWKTACAAGYQVSCVDLAWLLSSGHGGPIDTNAATTLRTKACDAGYGAGCSYLAANENDAQKSRELYEKACERGDTTGCLEAGSFYEVGEGVPIDITRALKFYARAFFAPVEADISLACPEGTRAFREVREITFAYTITEVAVYCGRPGSRRPEKHGPFIEFASLEDEAVHGVMSARGNHVDDKKDGVWETYDSRGRLRSKSSYRSGNEHGTEVRHRPQEGGYSESTEYVDGKRHGPYKESGYGGRWTGNYQHGKKHGTWTELRDQGGKTVTKYDRGRIVGDQIEFYRDGSVHHRIPHDSEGRRHGSYIIYNEKGGIRYETVYVRGERAKRRWYHNNGKLSSETLYEDGDEISERRFDSKGRAIAEDDW